MASSLGMTSHSFVMILVTEESGQMRQEETRGCLGELNREAHTNRSVQGILPNGNQQEIVKLGEWERKKHNDNGIQMFCRGQRHTKGQ